MAEKKETTIGEHALWSGMITFGMVSIPVSLLPGNRSRPVALRTLSPDGFPLRRGYFCPQEEKLLSAEEIVRGYEVERDRFVVVTDEELNALEPQKSREIDLRRFVPREDLDARYFDRAYFLVPAGDSKKAYLLLADAMERTQRVGIATFVMRGKEYLVTIMAEGGILQVETLRFADEIRTPGQLGLPEPLDVDPDGVEDLAARITAAKSEGFDQSVLQDPYAEQLQQLARAKQKTEQDVIEMPETGAEAEETGAEVIDLMEILRQSLDIT